MVASTGLEFPTGLVVAPNGWVYVSNYGVLPATGGPGGLSGEIVKLHLGSGYGHWSGEHWSGGPWSGGPWSGGH